LTRPRPPGPDPSAAARPVEENKLRRSFIILGRMELRSFASRSGKECEVHLSKWISHCPHMTLMSLTTDKVPGLNNILALGMSVACLVVIGRALLEISAEMSWRNILRESGHRSAGLSFRAWQMHQGLALCIPRAAQAH
jgi:hypothetical protein